MKRRRFLQHLPAAALLSTIRPAKARQQGRVRPGDAAWPGETHWAGLRQAVGGRLVKVASPWDACRTDAGACAELFRQLRNPYFIRDNAALTQTTGWVDAWTSEPSVYAVEARMTSDVVAAVDFAREHRLRLVIKGGGHSYQGMSNAPDSLLIRTRAMNEIVLHDDFVPRGCAAAPQPAVSLGAGAIWRDAYDAVTVRGGRYVQGGGCLTVGVAGLVQSGGFGSFSKAYGTAAAALLEAEIVTADGAARIANACTHPDLFWAVKGGGGGTFGVVTRVTLRTRALPPAPVFGVVSARIKAASDADFRALVARTLGFYRDQLMNPHWGEQIVFTPGNAMQIVMLCQGLDQQQAETVWKPFFAALPAASFTEPAQVIVLPARSLWDTRFLRQNFAAGIVADDRPGAPPENIIWAGDAGQVGQFVHGYKSAWLPRSLLTEATLPRLVDALFAITRRRGVALHFNKGLAGAPPAEIEAARDTATNPAMLDAFALAIMGGEGPPARPGVPGREPDVAMARDRAAVTARAMDELLKLVPDAGSYLSESDYFQADWQRAFWGANYARLADVKKKYDPDGLFFVHHGVGSEDWSADGFSHR